MDTFEKKSREASVEPPAISSSNEEGYSQARKLSDTAVEREEEEGGQGDLNNTEEGQSSDEDDII